VKSQIDQGYSKPTPGQGFDDSDGKTYDKCGMLCFQAPQLRSFWEISLRSSMT